MGYSMKAWKDGYAVPSKPKTTKKAKPKAKAKAKPKATEAAADE